MKSKLITMIIISKNHSRLTMSTNFLTNFFMTTHFMEVLCTNYIPKILSIDYQSFKLVIVEFNSPNGNCFPKWEWL